LALNKKPPRQQPGRAFKYDAPVMVPKIRKLLKDRPHLSQKKVAEILNISEATVGRFAMQYDLPFPGRIGMTSLLPLEIAKCLLEDPQLSLLGIARKLGVGVHGIKRACSVYGIKTRGHKRGPVEPPNLRRKHRKIIQLAEEYPFMPVREIGRRVKLSGERARQVLAQNGFHVIRFLWRPREEDLLRLVQSGVRQR
jgi:hypothetical protein